MGLSLSIVPSPVLASANSCLRVVHAWKEAVDCQVNEAIQGLTWPDGYTQSPQNGRGKWSDISMTGPCPKYATTFKEVRVSPVKRMSQSVEVKVVSHRVDTNGRRTEGDEVGIETYTCKRRNGQWRIYSKVVAPRIELRNHTVARRHGKAR